MTDDKFFGPSNSARQDGFGRSRGSVICHQPCKGLSRVGLVDETGGELWKRRFRLQRNR